MPAPSTAPTPKAAGTGTQVVVTQADISDVATKLDEFAAVLNDREKAILLGVFSLAAAGLDDAAQASSAGSGNPAQPQSSVPSLSSGFRTAFQNGVGTRFTVDSSQTEAIGGKLGIDFTF